MTNALLCAIVVLLVLIWRDIPARRFSESVMTRILKALEAIAEKEQR